MPSFVLAKGAIDTLYGGPKMIIENREEADIFHQRKRRSKDARRKYWQCLEGRSDRKKDHQEAVNAYIH